MQRWIVVGVVAVVLALAGGSFGIWQIRQNRPDKVWVPIPLNPQLPEEERLERAAHLKEQLLSSGVLLQISKDLGLAEKWHLKSDDEAAAEVGKRLFLEVGYTTTLTGEGPSLNVGVTGLKKEHNLIGDISLSVTKEVWKILGVKPAASENP